MAKYLYTLLVCSICSAKIWFGGTPNTLFIVTNSIVYIDNTNKVTVVNKFDIFGDVYLTTRTTNQSPIDARKTYRSLGPDNILVICLSNDVESLQSASMATSLWGSSSILMLNDSNIRTCIPKWAVGAGAYVLPRPTNDVQMIDMTNQYDELYGDELHSWNFYYAWQSNSFFLSDFVNPIVNYVSKNPQYKILACAYKMPHRPIPSSDNDGPSVIHDFFYESYGYPFRAQTNITMFSFSCRRFEDSSNLLCFANGYVLNETNGWYVFDALLGSSFVETYDYWTNRISSPNVIIRSSETAANRVTNSPGPVYCVFSRGFWDGSGVNLDSMWRNTYAFRTVPTSIGGSIESYNMSSYRRGYDARTHQTRLFDCFDRDCNRTIVPYENIYGCAAGHVSEPQAAVIMPQALIYNLGIGCSFVDSVYKSLNAWSDYYYTIGYYHTIHIVCGHPFLRITKGE